MSLIAAQDKLIATLTKCYRTNKKKGYFSNAWSRKSPAARVAENKCWNELNAMGFTDQQAHLAVLDACDMAKLIVECEA